MVVLFSEDPARWRQGYIQYAQTTVSRPPAAQQNRPIDFAWVEPGSKTLQLSRMVPGRYLIMAIPQPEVDNPTHPRILERLRRFAVPITLIGGATAKVDLRVTRVR